jgi:DNA-binding XRE family transcriptional regulator
MLENPLKVFRNNLNLSVEEFAEWLEIGPVKISNIERGKCEQINITVCRALRRAGFDKYFINEMCRQYTFWKKNKDKEFTNYKLIRNGARICEVS